MYEWDEVRWAVKIVSTWGVNGGVKFGSFFIKKLRKVTLSDW